MADPFIKEVAAYLSFDGGTNGSSAFTVWTPPWESRTNETGAALAVGSNGAAAFSTARSKFGTSSLQLTGGYVYLGSPAINDGNRPTTPTGFSITFEGWFWFNDNATARRIMGCSVAVTGQSERAWGLGITSAGKLRLSTYQTNFAGVGTTTVTTGAWHHIACVQEAVVGHRVYLDGNLEISGGGLHLMNTALLLGDYPNTDVGMGSTRFDGNVCELVVTHAVKYVDSSFTVPSGALDITGLPTFLDASSVALIGAYRAPLFSTVSTGAVHGPRLVRDVYFGGTGKVRFDTAIDDDPDLPVSRKTWLVRTRDAQVIREQWSDPVTGEGVFLNVDTTEKYAVIAFDHTHLFNAVIADNITPEAM